MVPFLLCNNQIMYRYKQYILSHACTQIDLIHQLFAGDRLQSTRTIWANSLCKLVRKNERSLFEETRPYLLVAIDDTVTLAEFDRLQSAYPHLVLVQSVLSEQRQEADEIGN